jgi:adenylate cyclase
MTMHRKLVAILAGDVAGYSRLMAEDEPATLRLLNDSRTLFRERVEAHRGRLVDTAGDSVLAEFPSAVEAVACAVEIQGEIARRNEDLPENRRMLYRIGVNLGDVIEEDAGLYGDGVNVAARLQTLAEPGGLCISGTVADYVEGKLPMAFKSLGDQTFKNISRPVKVYRWVPGSPPVPRTKDRRVTWGLLALGAILAAVGTLLYQQHDTTTGRASADKNIPTLAVLPFNNMSEGTKDTYFSDGLTETLITDLSKLRNLYVIARTSSSAYKGKVIDLREIGKELGARYVLEGSVQRTSHRLRVNVQLIDASTGRHLWAERYDRNVSDVFDVQDEITHRIVTELEVKLLHGEEARVWRKSTRNREAYDLYLRAREIHDRFTEADVAHAQGLYQKALELDPKFTMAMVWLGWTYYIQGDSGWTKDPTRSYHLAEQWAREAIKVDPALGEAYTALCSFLQTLERHDEAIQACETAAQLAPNSAEALVLIGWAYSQLGRADEGVDLVRRAQRMNPYSPAWWYGAMGDALLFMNRQDEAIVEYKKSVTAIPDFIWGHFGLTVAYVETGRYADAEKQAQALRKINPTITAEKNTYVRSIRLVDRPRIIAALRRAGLPAEGSESHQRAD